MEPHLRKWIFRWGHWSFILQTGFLFCPCFGSDSVWGSQPNAPNTTTAIPHHCGQQSLNLWAKINVSRKRKKKGRRNRRRMRNRKKRRRERSRRTENRRSSSSSKSYNPFLGNGPKTSLVHIKRTWVDLEIKLGYFWVEVVAHIYNPNIWGLPQVQRYPELHSKYSRPFLLFYFHVFIYFWVYLSKVFLKFFKLI